MTTPPLVPLEEGWALWPVFEVRAAGFPVSLLEPLAAPRTVKALEGERALATAVSKARTTAMDALHAVLRASPEQRATVNKLMGALRKHQRGVHAGIPEVDRALAALEVARAAVTGAQAEAQRLFDEDLAGATAALKSNLQGQLLRQALLLQNRQALKGGLDAWLRNDEERTVRKARVAVATYLQRYTTKNDTVGFFGPVGWGTFSAEALGLEQAAGPHLVNHASVHLEPWAVAVLADVLGDQVISQLVPRVSPRVQVEGDELHGLPGRTLRGTRPLPARWKRVLALLEAPTPATIGTLTADEELGAATSAMLDQGVLEVRLPVLAHLRPHDALGAALERLGATTAAVQEVERARAAVEAAFAHAEPLEAALTHLDATFERLTGEHTTRNHGKTYGSRTLTYTNCRRDHALTLGAQTIDPLKAPLSLLLQAARWFTHDVARRFLWELKQVYTQVSAQLQTPTVPLVTVYSRLIALFEEQPPAFLKRSKDALAERWQTLLALDGRIAQQHFDSAPLRTRAAELFAAPGPGFPLARHHSPDLLFRRVGNGWEAVIGETHAGVNTLGVLQAVDMHPQADQLRALFRRDVPGPALSELQHDDYALCAHDSLLDATDFHLDTGSRFASWLPEGRTLPLSAFSLSETAGYFVCEHRPTGTKWDVLQVLEKMLRLNLTTEFHLPALTPHSPRVTVDRVVLARESWAFERAAFASWVEGEGLARFRAAVEFRRTHTLPRFVFARVPGEYKPMYLDFESPMSVEVLCRMMQTADSLKLSEMLPTPHDAWLEDASSARYVSELRVVAVDPLAWKPIAIPTGAP